MHAAGQHFLSEWIKAMMSLVNRCISVLRRTMPRRHESLLDDQDVSVELAELHHKFVVVGILCLFAKLIISTAQWRSLVQQQETLHINSSRCLGKKFCKTTIRYGVIRNFSL